MGGVVSGHAGGTALEEALVALARKSCEAPARLGSGDLDPLRRVAGDGALEYVLVLGAFHFINRIADLLHVDPEVPGQPWLRRVEPVRRAMVRVMSRLLGRMDLAIRPYPRTFDEVAAGLPPDVDRGAFEVLRPRPQVVEAIALALEERDRRSSLDRPTLARLHATVESALPATADDVQGLHERPADPVDAFAFVGTRYAHRATDATIRSLRARGFDDTGLLDLAIAVADANQWARMRRLLGLPAAAFTLSRA